MEIIHLVLGKANPNRMNGVNKVVHELATKQTHKGMQVSVWGITNSLQHNYPQRNFDTRLFAKTKCRFTVDARLRKAILLKKDKAVCHLHGGFIAEWFTLARFMQTHNIPFVLMPHGAYNTIAMQKNKWIKKLYFGLFESRLLNAASYIHCIGSSEVSGLGNAFSNKAVLIPYGFDMPQENNTHNPAGNHFIIGFCGRLDVYTKGLAELIDGFKTFVHAIPNARLWIIGDSNERTALEQQVQQAGLQEAVVFHGSQFGQDKLNLLRQCHVFASPSRNEGLPAAIIEAAALGLPCLVTEATNLGNAIRMYNAGAVITETRASYVARGLHTLYAVLSKPQQAWQIRQNAQRMIREQFHWNKTLTELDKMYYQAFTN